MRVRALFLFAAIGVGVVPAIAWGGPTMHTSAGVMRTDPDGTANGHNYTVLATGVRLDGTGTVGGQA